MGVMWNVDNVSIQYDAILSDFSPNMRLLADTTILIHQLLLIKYLQNIYSDSSLYIPNNFTQALYAKLRKHLTKEQSDVNPIINDLLNLIDSINNDSEYVIDMDIIRNYIVANTSNETLLGFTLPLLSLFSRNRFDYTDTIYLPTYMFNDTTCYVKFIALPYFSFSLSKSKVMGTFHDYFLSFNINQPPLERDAYYKLTLQLKQFLGSFCLPIIYDRHNISPFDIFKVNDITTLKMIHEYVSTNSSIRILFTLYYNKNLASIFSDGNIQTLMNSQYDDSSITSNVIVAIDRLVKSFGNIVSEESIDTIVESLRVLLSIEPDVVLTEFGSIANEYCNTNNEYNIKELVRIALEAEEDEPTEINESGDVPDDPGATEDNPPDEEGNEPDAGEDAPDEETQEESPGDDNPEEGSTDEDQMTSDQIQKSKLQLELDTEEPTIDVVLKKLAYYKLLNQLFHNTNIDISDSTRMLISYWIRYWIFVVNIKTTEKFIKTIKKEINNETV